MNRQKGLLLILILIFVATAVYAYLRLPRQKSVERLKFTSGKAAESVRQDKSVKPDKRRLHLELLDQPLPHFTGFRRNIFWLPSMETRKKLSLPPPPPPIPTPPPPPQPPPPSPEQIQQQAAKAEMAKFTFLGFLKKEKRKLIFLAKDKEIFVVQQGDRIARDYEVTSITDEALIMRSQSGGGELVIPLVENMPLQTSARK